MENSIEHGGPQDNPVESRKKLEMKVLESAEERFARTQEYFHDAERSLEDFADLVLYPPFSLSVDTEDPVSVTAEIFRLQADILKLSPEDSDRGCNGTMNSFTYNATEKYLLEYQTREAEAALKNQIKAEHPEKNTMA